MIPLYTHTILCALSLFIYLRYADKPVATSDSQGGAHHATPAAASHNDTP